MSTMIPDTTALVKRAFMAGLERGTPMGLKDEVKERFYQEWNEGIEEAHDE